MARYSVTAKTTVIVDTMVEADSEEEAIAAAKERFGQKASFEGGDRYGWGFGEVYVDDSSEIDEVEKYSD